MVGHLMGLSGHARTPARDKAAPPLTPERNATGLGLGVLLAGWPLFAAPEAPGTAKAAGIVLIGVGAWTVGVLAGRHRPVLAAGALTGLVVVALLSGLPGSLTADPQALPLGYANANAALAAAAVLALVTVSHLVADRSLHRAMVAAAVTLTVLVAASGSQAGTATCVLMLAAAPVLPRGRRLLWQGVAVGVMGAASAVTAWLALTPGTARPDIVVAALSETRISLWEDALDLAGQRPLVGVGAGEFALQSPVALADPDLAWAHSTPLQVLAEQGVVGLLLLTAVVAWLVWVLGRRAVLLAILALQPLVDYVLAFPAVVAAYGLALGLAAVTPIGPAARAGGLPTRHRTSS